MSSSTIKINSRSKNVKSLEITTNSYQDFLNQLSKSTRLNSNRLRITTLDKKPINSDEGLINEKEVYVKDLGPQIGYRTVFMIEYFGPILVHYLVYQLASKPVNYELIYHMNLIHYGKRELETVLVHKFSNSTMPLFNVFKNSAHYWILGGLLSLMYFDLGNLPIDLGLNEDYLFYIWCICEFFNGITHIQLRLLGDKSIRKGKERQVPSGGLFELFISPNYTMEIYGWTIIFLINPNIFSLVFLITGATQMYFWSIKKQKRYGTKRAFLLPFIF